MSRPYLALGAVLLGVSGILLASAVYDGGPLEWVTALLAALLGVLSMLAGATQSRIPRVDPQMHSQWNPDAAPRLGDMLVSYGILTQADLDRALAYQQGTGKRLGQILVELDLVTHAQVAQVLEEQLSRREGRLMWGAGAQLIS